MSQQIKVLRSIDFHNKGSGSRIQNIDVDDNANIIYWRPDTDDTGALYLGDGTKDMDVRVYLGSSTEYVLFDVGNSRVDFGEDDQGLDIRIFGDTASSVLLWDTSDNRLEFDGCDLNLQDSDILQFGDAQDVTMTWDGSALVIVPVADDTGAINIGDGTTDIDLKVFLSTSAKYALFDVGNVYLTLEDVDLHLGDNDEIHWGDATQGDIRAAWNGTLLQFTPATDDTGYIAIGTGSANVDFRVNAGGANYLLVDVGNNYLDITGLSLLATDLATSAGQAGIVYVDASGYLIQSD